MFRTALFRRILLLPALLLLLAPAISLSQSRPAPVEELVAEAAPAEPVAPAPAEPGLAQLTPRLYLPMLRNPPEVSATIGTGYNSSTGQITGVAVSFAYGIEEIYVQARVVGGAGLTFRQDFIFADGEKITGSTIAIPNDPYTRTVRYCISSTGSCGTGRDILPRGVYTLQIFLNDVLHHEQSVMII
jgi:hypothetical protein